MLLQMLKITQFLNYQKIIIAMPNSWDTKLKTVKFLREPEQRFNKKARMVSPVSYSKHSLFLFVIVKMAREQIILKRK